MIIPDVNLLIYAYNDVADHHEQARAWWEECLSGRRIVSLPWAVILGYVRIATNRRALVSPISTTEALLHVRTWLSRSPVQILNPGSRHLDILSSLMEAGTASGNLTSDAHLAALALENQAELHSNDTDFGRFPGLRWRNPLT